MPERTTCLARVALLLTMPTLAAAQSAYHDSVQAIPCSRVVAEVATRALAVQGVYNAFRCRGDRDAVAVALWRRPLREPALLYVFRAAVPGSARTVALMFDAAQADSSIERRLTAVGVLARFVDPVLVVTADDAERRFQRDPTGALHYSLSMVNHPGPQEPIWGPLALEHIDELARYADDERVRAASKAVRRMFDVRRGSRLR